MMIARTIIDTVQLKELYHTHIHKETIATTAQIVNITHLRHHLKAIIDTHQRQIAAHTAMDKIVIRYTI